MMVIDYDQVQLKDFMGYEIWKIWDITSSGKKVNVQYEVADENEKRKEDQKKAADAMRKLGLLTATSVYQEKEKDWALHAGVATAIYLGGPGAVFWMWVTAILGGALHLSNRRSLRFTRREILTALLTEDLRIISTQRCTAAF